MINVLSLFDGISCGRLALKRSGIKIDKYFASEIDNSAIAVTQSNFPDTIQLGDVRKISGNDLPRIDLLIGGSPCTGFSFAGKQLNFSDSRSALFFEYVRLLKECNPTYFLLENVVMKKEFQSVISNCLGVEPIKINSALLSAQNRERLYWTNIPNIIQPKDKNIKIKDVLFSDALFIARMVGRRVDENGVRHDYDKDIKAEQRLEIRIDDKSGTLTTVQKDNTVVCASNEYSEFFGFKIKDMNKCSDEDKIILSNLFKRISYKILKNKNCIRYLDPIECERLQTIEDNYTASASRSQRCKQLGNAWTVDVISHIFQNIKGGI
jgi:DNA-cytosine methyltransferase